MRMVKAAKTDKCVKTAKLVEKEKVKPARGKVKYRNRKGIYTGGKNVEANKCAKMVKSVKMVKR